MEDSECIAYIMGGVKGSVTFKAKREIQDLRCQMSAEISQHKLPFPGDCPSGCHSLQSNQTCPIMENTEVVYDFLVNPGVSFGIVMALFVYALFPFHILLSFRMFAPLLNWI